MPGLPAELAGLLAACRSSPADDTARLVLADWLEEHPESVPDAAARASLVRVQVELSQPSNDTARVNELRLAERQIVAEYGEKWAGKLPKVLRKLRGAPQMTAFAPVTTSPVTFDGVHRRHQWGFHRGMLWLWLNAYELHSAGVRKWFASDLAPWVAEAMLSVDTVRQLSKLAVSPELEPYVGVVFDVGGEPPDYENPRSRRTVWDEKVFREVLRGRNFRLVRSLRVEAPAVAAGFLGMMRTADVSGLRFLNVSNAGLADRQAIAIADAPLENLSLLDVSGNVIGPQGMREFVKSPHLKRLVTLVAFRNRIGDLGLKALAQSPLAESLNAVSLQNNMIGGPGVRALCESPLLARLSGPGLNLSMNKITDAGAKALAGSEALGNFRELILRENAIGPAGAKAIAESPHAANLTYLDLFKNKIGDRGAKALAESESLGRVKDLSLRDNGITDRGAAALRQRYGERVKV